MEFVASNLERQDFQRAVGRITYPVFLHPKLREESLPVVTVPPDTGRRNDFNHQVRDAENGTTLNNASVGCGDKDQVRFDSIRVLENQIHRRNEDLAQVPYFDKGSK